MNGPAILIPILALVIPVVAVVLLGANIYRRYVRISRSRAALLFLAAIVGSVGLGLYRIDQLRRLDIRPFDSGNNQDEFAVVASVVLVFVLPLVAIPFMAKLYVTWIAGDVTDAEKAPGMDGVRAWLRGGNLFCAVVISLCLWLGFNYSFWTPLALALMALLSYPLLNMSTIAPQSALPKTDSLSPERERVLKMLDDGKITAQESANLLNALGHSAPPRPVQTVTTPHTKMVLIGAVLLLVGFFLPWFAITTGDLQNEMNSAINRMPMMQGIPSLGGMLPQTSGSGMTISYSGGDITHGLGWWILLLGIAAAVLPYMAANLDSETRQKISLLALCAGAILLIYLLTQNVRYAGVGILLGFAGYVLEFIGTLKSGGLDWLRTADYSRSH